MQLVVGLVRQLGLDDYRFGKLRGNLKQMGQEPLQPPNVKGWPGGRQWINTSTLFVRQNTALQLTGERGVALRHAGDAALSPDEVVDTWLARLVQRPIRTDRRQVLVDALGTAVNDNAVRSMINLIVSMPEYQLC